MEIISKVVYDSKHEIIECLRYDDCKVYNACVGSWDMFPDYVKRKN